MRDDDPDIQPGRGLPFRALAPNAITAMALCFGLTGVRYAVAAAGDPRASARHAM